MAKLPSEHPWARRDFWTPTTVVPLPANDNIVAFGHIDLKFRNTLDTVVTLVEVFDALFGNVEDLLETPIANDNDYQ